MGVVGMNNNSTGHVTAKMIVHIIIRGIILGIG